jgi:hypothetical protein
MSEKERIRRKIARMVLRQAGRYKKRDPLSISLSLALTLGWAVVRSGTYVHHTKVRGVTFENRQRILETLSRVPAERVSLRILHEGNSYDENAMRIYAIVDGSYRACVGYLSKDLASIVAPQVDRGKRCVAFINEVTGGRDKRYGLNLCYIII